MSLRQIMSGLMFFFILSFLGTFSVHAQSAPHSVIIINQVRGEECCGKGNLANLETQLKTVTRLGLPATFVVRYDALKDAQYVSLLKKYRADFPQLIDIGVMIEIIPSLAVDAGVSYKGSQETWYQAHHAFTIGYPRETRKKMIDVLFGQYASAMGAYPRVSSSWMIDTDSLNYIQLTYGVQYQQITREQWGTDSYTLYGGPPHFPYPASKNWLMVPDFARTDAPMIIRQTVTDPIHNYGDTTSSHTTQPNDYMRNGSTIEYFQKLISQAFDPSINPVGFACLGLENNMEEKYQLEYVKQLEWIKEYSTSKNITFEKVTRIKNQFMSQRVTSYTGRDGSLEATWITTQQYRIRLLQKEGLVSITDIRVFSPDLTDPYNDTIAKHEGYWVVPFLLDGSRWYDGYGSIHLAIDHVFTSTEKDITYPPSRLILPQTKSDTLYTVISSGDNMVDITDGTTERSRLSLTFSEQVVKITLTSSTAEPYQLSTYTPLKFPVTYSSSGLQWLWDGKPAHAMKISKNDKLATITFDTTHSSEWNTGRYIYYPYAYPESTGRVMSEKYTTISVDNMYAIAGRNPIRLVLQPHDGLNFPIILDDEPEIKTTPPTLEVRRLGELRKSQYQYVDIFSDIPTKVDASIVFKQKNDRITKEITGYIAPDCKRDIKACLINPRGSFWYILTKVNDWWRSR
ncbi:MAG: hypothetical protein WCO78_04275 [Candidatus Roizmanbacteria bacterium]